MLVRSQWTNEGWNQGFLPSDFYATPNFYISISATKVLDPTTGLRGRMLGAYALDIEYTGIDTNENMIDAYQEMMNKLDFNKLTMIFHSCLEVDFSTIDYDFVLTSPLI